MTIMSKAIEIRISPPALSAQDILTATLPERYVAARSALEKCAATDEVHSWKNQAAALATYARQANDDELLHFAKRIQGRAVRRLGEMMREQDKAKGGQPYQSTGGKSPPVGAPPTLAEAGISKDLAKQARAVAAMPAERFEELIESDDPPSPGQLAELSKSEARALHELSRPKPKGFAEATQALGAFRQLAEFCEDHSPELIAGGLERKEPARLLADLDVIAAWSKAIRSLLRKE